MIETSSRVDWVLPNHDLAQRLDRMWSGETWRNDDADGLAATLDAIPEWSGWESWDSDQQIEALEQLLLGWEQPAGETASAAEPEMLPEDTSQPRWNPDSGYWEVYNTDRAQWWSYDADSGTWYDPVAAQWVSCQLGAEPGTAAGGEKRQREIPSVEFIDVDEDDGEDLDGDELDDADVNDADLDDVEPGDETGADHPETRER